MANTRSREMREMVARMTVRSGYDVVLAEYSVMGQYLYKNYGINSRTKRVVSCHESYTLARRRALELYGFFSREGFDSWLNLYRLKQYEFAMYKYADLLLTLTPQEKERILKIEPDLKIEVVPHGTDTERFSLFPESDREISVAFLGNYPHNPNADAVMFFIREIWPDIKSRIGGIKFYVIGRGPTREILSEAKRDKDIIVTGEVDDVRDHLKKAMVFVAPLRLGYGFRGKTLEAMAMGIPVVTTSLGAEGLLVRNMENIIIADQPKQFAGAVVQLFEDRELYTRVSKNSRITIEEHFSYRKGAEKLGEVLKNLVKQG
ncbi:MAG: glycosyltransferase [Candidatus Humimicrobiaceae bacterium]